MNVAQSKNKVYCACTNAIFYLNKSENSFHKLSKLNVLSDVQISTIAYNEADDILIVGYKNGNIDIVSSTGTLNVTDIKTKQSNSSKNINSILFFDNKAFLSTDFCIAVLDYKKGVFLDSYMLGTNSGFYVIHNISVDTVSRILYTATNNGVFMAKYDGTDLADFNSWTQLASFGKKDYSKLCFFDGKLLVHSFDTAKARSVDSLFIYENSKKTVFKKQYVQLSNITAQENNLCITSHSIIDIYRKDSSQTQGLELFKTADSSKVSTDPFGAIFSDVAIDENDGTLWISDGTKGLLHSTDFKAITPSSPARDDVSDIAYTNNTLFVTHGIPYTYRWSQPSFLFFDYNQWYSTINWATSDDMRITVVPGEDFHYFIGTTSRGIYEGDSWWNYSSNTLLSGWSPVQGLKADSKKNIYIATLNVNFPLYCYTSDKKWVKWTYPQMPANYLGVNGITLIIDSLDRKWIGTSNEVLVFNDNNTIGDVSDDSVKVIPILDNAGNNFSVVVTALAVDKSNVLWIGTANGLAYYPNVKGVFYDSAPLMSRTKVTNNGVVDYLLGTEQINSIEIDAANRKWVGTNSGLYLLDASGSKVLQHFTSDNSPLPSNSITSLKVIPEKSLIMIGTYYGLVSYNMGIKVANQDLHTISIYPNPVKPDYTGLITIEGLMENTMVRIMNVSGAIVYETMSNGGTAFWDGTNLSGNKVASGVYIVSSSSSDNSQQQISKIFVVR